MQEKTELELIADGREGDEAAIAELFRRHYASSLRLARTILRCEDESQDAVQVAYFSAFRHLDRFRGDASFKTWITRIVVNSCLIRLREPRRQFTWVHLEDLGERGSDMLTSPAPTPEKSTWCSEITSAFSDAVSRLPKQLREVYTLYSVSGLSILEVATALGLTVSAAKARLFRARAGLRWRLQPVWSAMNSGAARMPARQRANV
jgi:RNA polymerase sigma-70 factor (ECF subfamily)